MSSIYPGAWVRCINGSPHAATGASGLVVGRVYRIDAVHRNRWPLEDEVEVDGAPLGPNGRRLGWLVSRFEPLDRRSFDHLLNVPAPTPEECPA